MRGTTEHRAHRASPTSPGVRGLLNATFGNATEHSTAAFYLV